MELIVNYFQNPSDASNGAHAFMHWGRNIDTIPCTTPKNNYLLV